jgi:hypothetical protein
LFRREKFHRERLGSRRSWGAFVAAATLRGYLDEMDGDGFLALLAYIIGPRAGCGGTGSPFPLRGW